MNEIQWLLSEFKRRRVGNPAYSMRAFSRDARLSAGRLSEYLAGKRALTPKVAGRIFRELGIVLRPEDSPFTMLVDETFAVIADWQHYAILSLIETADFQTRESWIARRLGISSIEVRESVMRLHRVGLIKKKISSWVLTHENLTTTQDIECSALRASHKQSLAQAISSLDDVALDLRDISSITMAINSSQLPLAKVAIREFRRSMMQILESGPKDEVYNLNIQLVPLTKREKI